MTRQTYEQLESQYEDIETLIEMGYEENDASVIPEIEEDAGGIHQRPTTIIRMKTLLSGEYDSLQCDPDAACRGRRHRSL